VLGEALELALLLLLRLHLRCRAPRGKVVGHDGLMSTLARLLEDGLHIEEVGDQRSQTLVTALQRAERFDDVVVAGRRGGAVRRRGRREVRLVRMPVSWLAGGAPERRRVRVVSRGCGDRHGRQRLAYECRQWLSGDRNGQPRVGAAHERDRRHRLRPVEADDAGDGSDRPRREVAVGMVGDGAMIC
jgi:hypothetical protein